MKNLCPSCGGALFSTSDMNHIAMMQNRIGSQSFAKNLDEIQIFDLALFIYNEIQTGYGQAILEERIKNIKTSASTELDGTVESKHQAVGTEESEPEIDVREIVKKEVEDEIREKIMENIKAVQEDVVFHEDDEDDDEDYKIKRLKEQAAKHNKNVTGVSVRRVS
jgi:glucose-6-phosphate-specific signal transduction histidine kinase